MARPDYAAALMLYLRLSSEIAEFTGNRIYIEWPKSRDNAIIIPKFQNCILINSGRGGRGVLGMGQYESRVDLFCYGANRKTANDLWRTVDEYIMPNNERRKSNFELASTKVYWIMREAGESRLVDADADNWPYTFAPYIVRYGHGS